MSNDIRWIAVHDSMLVERLRMPSPTVLLFVSAFDVLAALDRPLQDPGRTLNDLRDTLELLIAAKTE